MNSDGRGNEVKKLEGGRSNKIVSPVLEIPSTSTGSEVKLNCLSLFTQQSYKSSLYYSYKLMFSWFFLLLINKLYLYHQTWFDLEFG